MGFSKDFIWGAASSAYQIEGAAYDEGKGLSVWDVMCRRADAVRENHTGDIACDHCRRYKEDVAMMAQLGLKAYRFSVSWPRVLPDGVGKINNAGLDFYDKLVDELLKWNISPYITLFHWDYPYELYCRGGWLNNDSSDWFSEYTKAVVERLSDRVENWMTINEPQVFLNFGHKTGIHAPGLKLPLMDTLRATHNILLSHGKAVQAIRSFSKGKVLVGYAPVGFVKIPATSNIEDINVARNAMFSIDEPDYMNNTWWMDPVFNGEYPQDGLKIYEKYMPEIKPQDMKIISQPLDYFGVNIYHGQKVIAGENNKAKPVKTIGSPVTSFLWPVEPESLYWGPKFFYERYKLPIIITENGLSNNDWVELDGRINDYQRIDFMKRYLIELDKAVSDNIDVRGYFAWSIMDNFEWAEGFTQRFGMVYVDFDSLNRFPKKSAYWYKNVIESNGSGLHIVNNLYLALPANG